MAHHTSTNSATVATNMDRFNNFQSARPVGSSVWVLNQPYIILYKWKLVFIDLCPNYCCLYRLLGMELSARDNGFATTALQCRWRDSTSGAPDISQGGQLCMGDSHAWNTCTGKTIASHTDDWAIKVFTSNGSWCMGIKSEMSGMRYVYMGLVTEVWLSCYLVLLSTDSKTR